MLHLNDLLDTFSNSLNFKSSILKEGCRFAKTVLRQETNMRNIFICSVIVFFGLLPLNAQTGSSAWEKGEKEIFLGSTIFIRPQIMDIGSTVQDFFYDTSRDYTIESPLKIARGKYRIRCIIGSEYTDDKIYLFLYFVRISVKDVLVESILLQNSTRPRQQMIASSFEEIMYILMRFF